ncbi:tyrosine-type recombinase/integrase [Rhodobacteraceae bacterium 2CG4]|uniref:Tyrosine-type recombinase/integrase n=1 Tax=Halovulum marinum TaxID=2662447 RepID=A0A6L5Z1D2_9RHOB|nr:tyrosine-type recombinase/integrase [Halovulum marinum]
MHIEGLHREVRKGVVRYRVAEKANPKKRCLLPRAIDPQHPRFGDYYRAYRNGSVQIDAPIEKAATKRSVEWLVTRYIEFFEKEVKAGLKSKLTLSRRRNQLVRLCEHPAEKGGTYGEYDLDLPTVAWEQFNLDKISTPGEADNTMKAVRAMYELAMKRGWISHNPAKGVKAYKQNKGGAKPWTPEDMKQYRERHPAGTMAHLYLTLLMFAGARISDAVWLGPKQLAKLNGRTDLKWQPKKKGSAPVMLPVMPPLDTAIKAQKVVHPDAFIPRADGQPFASSAALGNKVRDWITQAGLTNRSSHGVRKSVAELLSESGMTQYQVMSVLAHTEAKSSEIYTKDAERRRLAERAMNALEGYEW